MERALTHRQVQELLGAYALDAVDPDEAALVEAHVAECPRCFAEVAEHREAAAMMGNVGAPAPEGVWEKIAARLDPAGATAGTDADATAAAAEIVGLADARARRAGADTGADVGHSAADGARRARVTRWLSTALAAAAVIVAVLGVQLVRVERRLDTVVAAMSRDGLRQAALQASLHRDARQVHLTSEDGATAADAVLLPDGQAFLLARSLPALSEAETYQLWAVIGDQKISVGVLGHAPEVIAFRYDADPSVLAITAERAGGVVASQKQAVVVGSVPTRSA